MTALVRVSSPSSLSVPDTNSPLIRSRVCLDAGNRWIKWLSPTGSVRLIPAFIKSIDPTWEEVEGGDHSVVVQLSGETFVIGQAAKDLNGAAIFQGTQGDKTELIPKLMFAALEPNPGQSALRVERLLVALPDSRSAAHLKVLKSIEGTHEFTRNGHEIVASIRRVEAVDETRAAYCYGARLGWYLSQKNLNRVLDFGGGTAIARLYSTDGGLIREADVILPGTYDLARRIAARIARDLPTSPDLSLVMDAIADGTFQLGTTGYDFKPVFEKCRDEWLTDIRAEIKTKWNQWLPKLGEVLMIGGSAELARPLEVATKQRFKIARDAQTVSVVGMEAL
ncbi:ParM/StbA family protein [Leptolyngbya sp. FACHB-36]|uniref:ParM/StbA family protein n=1 Tax=Leptolyngbya sp. FACHB-36 TaxID=2692808 RepID=UPI00167FF46D|nr:ParM/StbA family protein [Leptolyngbya sp. FACHB-36]MBD2019920.1 ParM/StbA family protein [Leptolyngbya sp. FACHB-36]